MKRELQLATLNSKDKAEFLFSCGNSHHVNLLMNLTSFTITLIFMISPQNCLCTVTFGIDVDEERIWKLLEGVRGRKSLGRDRIGGRLLKCRATVLYTCLYL